MDHFEGFGEEDGRGGTGGEVGGGFCSALESQGTESMSCTESTPFLSLSIPRPASLTFLMPSSVNLLRTASAALTFTFDLRSSPLRNLPAPFTRLVVPRRANRGVRGGVGTEGGRKEVADWGCRRRRRRGRRRRRRVEEGGILRV